MAIFILYSIFEDEPISVWGSHETAKLVTVIKQNLKTFKKQFEIDVSKITSKKMPSGLEELITSDFKQSNLAVTVIRKDDQTLECTFTPTLGETVKGILKKLLS